MNIVPEDVALSMQFFARKMPIPLFCTERYGHLLICVGSELILRLTPVAFDEDPSAVVLGPVGGHPLRVRVRRGYVPSGYPDITASVPAMVSAAPDITLVRRRSGVLDDNRGRGNANNNLRERWRRRKRTSNYSDECQFLHGCFLSSL